MLQKIFLYSSNQFERSYIIILIDLENYFYVYLAKFLNISTKSFFSCNSVLLQ